MKFRHLCLLTLLVLPALSFAQSLPAPLAQYRSPSNPVYWGNRSPYGGYWQQDVYYQINATITPDSNRLDGVLTLTYYNNSPDTLREAFFHLYQNAFQPESYYDQKLQAAPRKARYGPYESQKKGCVIQQFDQEGVQLKWENDNTIARVQLSKPVLPNSFTTFHINFSSWWDNGSEGRRMKLLYSEVKNAAGQVYKVKHFDGVHWYPRICAYDRKMAWDTDQHLGYEFYGDFGVYDVSLTFPGEYILDATGVMENENEMLPAALRKQVDVANFKDKPWGEPAGEIFPPNSPSKTWKFHAENVHDFAFTADPTYRIGEVKWEDVRCISLARESHASGWQDAAEFTSKIIRVYSEDIGRYLYPKMIVADADDGMEYPMLTLDGGSSPGYYGLLAHEVGHNWFYGMVGNNETYRALLDEGFTQFLTAWCMSKLVGAEYKRRGETVNTVYSNAYAGYINQAYLGYDGVIATHSHYFPDGFNYRMVYPKTATMLYNLQYVLGEEKFLGAMKHYFKKWRIAHPYVEDFTAAITEYANTDLTWFFDQWLDTDRKLDYAVKSVKLSEKNTKAEITFERVGEMQMPLDFVVISRAGDTARYTLPNTWYAKKEDKLTVLPKWTGYEQLNKTYTATVSVPGKFKKVIIDPSGRLADVNLLDNRSGMMPMKMKVSLFPQRNPWMTDWKNYRWHLRPNLWWNGYSGLQAGFSLSGNYMGTTGKTWLGVWLNTRLGQTTSEFDEDGSDHDLAHLISWKYTYSTPIRQFGPGFTFGVHSTFRDGLHHHGAMLSKKFARGGAENPRNTVFYGGFNFLYRPQSELRDYLIYSDRWNSGDVNTYLFAGVERNYPILGGNGKIKLELRNSSIGSNWAYSIGRMEARHNFSWKKFDFRTRVFGQYADGFLPFESKLYLAEGSPEEMYDSDYFRARGFFPGFLTDNNLGRNTSHLQFGGGLNLRGYTGYEAEFEDGSPAWYGNSGLSANFEGEFGKYIPFRPRKLRNFLRLHSYLFADGGIIAGRQAGSVFDEPRLSVFRMDAGLGFALDISATRYLRENPLTLRLDLPLWLNRPPATEGFFDARWVFSIGRAF